MTCVARPVGIHHLTPTLPMHVMQAAAPGPTALVQAGIHGDEVAGVHALQELLEGGYAPRRGRLIVIPVMHPAAYRARRRTPAEGLDLNRCFPGEADAAQPEPRLARRFMDVVLEERPQLVATLHESRKRYHPDVQSSYGQTLVYGVDPRPTLLDRALQRLNEGRSDAERFSPLYDPIPTASTEVIVDAIGCVGVCVETWMGFAERRRIEMQQQVVEVLLSELGVR